MLSLSSQSIRIIDMLRPYKGRLSLALIGMILTAATEPTLAWMMKPLLDKGFSGKPSFSLWLVPASIIGIFVWRGLSTFMTTYMMTWVSTKLLNHLRERMFTRLLDVPMDFYAHNAVGRTINAMMFETQQIVDMIKSVMTSIIRDSFTVIGLLGYLIFINWRLTLVALGLLPLIAFVVRLTGKRLRRLTRECLEVSAELTQVIEETTRAQQVIKIFDGKPHETQRFETQANRLRRYSMRMASTFAITVPITQIISACALAIVIVIVLLQSTQGQATVGDFVSFVTAMLMLLTPLKHLAEVNGPLQRGNAAAASVFELIDTPSERTSGKALQQRAAGRLDFVDVGFSYPAQHRAALADINLTVMPGETVAFVGMSGGGKSTLVNLVPSLYAASSGQILLDGEPIEAISLDSLRAQMAMVSQHVVLFDDTVGANIAYGDPHPDQDRIMAALKAAYLEDMLAGLPDGLDAQIGNNGSRLSGGQRQRMAIARAIYKDAPILILDEATSALDSESERSVQNALTRLMKGRTTLVIAHRLSTIERASRIVVLTAGRIAEIGTHTELLARNGTYANLYKLQFAGKESPLHA